MLHATRLIPPFVQLCKCFLCDIQTLIYLSENNLGLVFCPRIFGRRLEQPGTAVPVVPNSAHLNKKCSTSIPADSATQCLQKHLDLSVKFKKPRKFFPSLKPSYFSMEQKLDMFAGHLITELMESGCSVMT